MKLSIWTPIIFLVGIIILAIVICTTIIRVREFDHFEAMADKAVAIHTLNQEQISVPNQSRWNLLKESIASMVSSLGGTFIGRIFGL